MIAIVNPVISPNKAPKDIHSKIANTMHNA